MTEIGRKVLVLVVLLLFPALFLSLVWSLGTAETEGLDIDWGFTRWLLVIIGVIAFLAVFALASLLFDPYRPVEIETEEPEVTINITAPLPSPANAQPSMQSNEWLMLIYAILAGVAGGLLALLFLRKGDK